MNFDIITVPILVATCIILFLACCGFCNFVDEEAFKVACIEVCKGPPVKSSSLSCMCKDGLKERYVQPAK